MTPPARRRLLGLLGFIVLTLVVVAGAFAFLYRSFSHRLDEELGARLVAAATATATGVNDETWEGLVEGDPAVRARVEEELQGIRSVNKLSAVFLFDDGQVTVLDLGGYPEGEINPLLDFDVAAVTTALAGIPESTRLYENEGIFLKAAYAPVLGADGAVLGGVGVEANAAFFAVLQGIRTTMLGAGAAVVVVLAGLGVVFARIFAAQSGLEERLRRSETLAAMGQMTAMLAHEIRNPLGIIRGSAETLAETHGLQDDEIYRYIPEEVDRLHATVSAYLDFARPEGGAGSDDVRRAVERTTALLARDLGRRDVRLAVDLAEGSFPVRGSGGLLEQALLNLLLNARDAMPAGGDLRVALRRRRGRARITVSDTGAGMDEATRRRALDPFFTRKEKGSGLGLAVVARTVEEIGGRLDLDSRPGEGTTVTLDLELSGAEGDGT